MNISNEEYTKELEKALIFLCECYVKAKDMVAGCRENNGKADERYAEMWMHFPMIQGTASFAVQKIADLRTRLGNREANLMSMNDIFEKMREGRKTEREISDEMRKIVKNKQIC